MKVKCYNCGLVREAVMGEGACPECGFRKYSLPEEKIKEKVDRESLEIMLETYNMAKEWLEKKGYMTFRKKGIPSDPYEYRIKKKEEGLAFEIFEVKDYKKVKVRKIYFNGHIEGFKGDPCIINHIFPKINMIIAILKQMNKDYRDFIEKHLLADLPIESVTLTKLYQAQLERINNIKI